MTYAESRMSIDVFLVCNFNDKSTTMHPFVRILTFIFILLLMNFLSNSLLFWFFLSISVAAVIWKFKRFLTVIKRMRIFFLSIFIVYAFGTPGEYIWQYPVSIAPSYEGLYLGLIQIEKLVISLAALSILFSTNSKENLMLGLYVLLSPLKCLGFNVQTFAARLLLTFDYVEDIARSNKHKLTFQQLVDIHTNADDLHIDKVVVLQALPYNILDQLLIVVFIVVALLITVFKVSL